LSQSHHLRDGKGGLASLEKREYMGEGKGTSQDLWRKLESQRMGVLGESDCEGEKKKEDVKSWWGVKNLSREKGTSEIFEGKDVEDSGGKETSGFI